MMCKMWVVLFVALTGSHLGYGLPVRPTPQTYPHDDQSRIEEWNTYGGIYAAIPALALVVAAISVLIGCTWCYRHKDCKQPNEGADNQLFTASAAHLQNAQRVLPPDSGFSEPANNNIAEDNNNGPISLREMQNIANNNATAYIVSENEERNRISRESIVEFEPLPIDLGGLDPLEHCAEWFAIDDYPRNNLQYLREVGRGWFGRIVEGEIEEAGSTSTVAVKILNQNATLNDKARFLLEAKMFKDVQHEQMLRYYGKCTTEEPWILIFERCRMDLQQYLIVNRPRMTVLNESGVPLQLMCDVTSALAHLHSEGYTYGRLWSGSVMVRGEGENARAVLGRYEVIDPQHDIFAPEVLRRGAVYTMNSEIWSLGTLIWEVCSWGSIATGRRSPPPDLPCPYKSHLYQVMQLCWEEDPDARPTAAQVHALLQHLHATHTSVRRHDAGPSDEHFEQRWHNLKPNSIPKLDEHVAIVHAESEPLPASRSASLNNLHGSLEELSVAQPPPAPLDPWLEDIVAGSQDDVSYYRDVSDVIKNLDNILNSEKTSSSESSHQASPSRDNLSLDCKREYPVQSGLVKSPGITDFKNVLELDFAVPVEEEVEDEHDRDTLGTLSHSFERHSESASQHTLDTITPDTPLQDTDIFAAVDARMDDRLEEVVVEVSPSAETKIPLDDTRPETVDCSDPLPEVEPEVPKPVVDRRVPDLTELCRASVSNVSEAYTEDRTIVKKDCEMSCDSADIGTDNEGTKSVVDIKDVTDSTPLDDTELTDPVEILDEVENAMEDAILPKTVEETTSNEVDTLPSVTEEVSMTQENDVSQIKLESNTEDIDPESIETENNYSKDETMLVSDLIDTVTDSSNQQEPEADVEQAPVISETPVAVQNIYNDIDKTAPLKQFQTKQIKQDEPTELPPEIVQSIKESTPDSETTLVNIEASTEENDNLDSKENDEAMSRSDNYVILEMKEQSNESTVYMDLINNTNSQILNVSVTSNNEAVNNVNEENVEGNIVAEAEQECDASAVNKTEESTVYLDLPSFDVTKKTEDFLHMERMISSGQIDRQNVCASTPLTSDNSADNLNQTLESSAIEATLVLSDTKVPDAPSNSTKEQKSAPETVSPFESPSKSHHTDTYDENSSVVLGPFENCSLEFKSGKPIDLVELPREELLAFSSNFSEINLETPSPLRDGNFLNEVPDIVLDDPQFDDTTSITEPKVQEPPSDTDASLSGTEKHVSPSTPPNSPGIFLASTSQPKYLIDIDLNNELNNEPQPEPSTSGQEIDLNQIELQITSKLAMAENENNLNIEYSSPLAVEGLIEEDGATRESDAIPETYLAGNGDCMEEVREDIKLDEECVKALRNELELKLPLAQVAAIEPNCDGEWSSELPPPPELVVSYPGALSPIAEETGQQLSAYENDAQWNASIRTESSESYPEPCNNSDATEAPTGQEHTYTLDNPTYTQHRDIPTSSREITMSADSLNASPRKVPNDIQSPIDDKTYTKEDEKESCEHISQVSPFLVSPTTDTSGPSDNFDNPTGASTLSKTTLPTDAKLSKPTETQCLSKATSIDSWCSNDTLYNVEENFDDMAMDPEVVDFEHSVKEDSESSDTLTHNEDKDLSHCSTYIIHDSKSDACETFSPDSITANANNTYTKVKDPGTTPSMVTDVNDSTKNTQTKDLAYGTLMSGMPSISNCTTEIASGFEESWKLPQPEFVRQSSICDIVNMTAPVTVEQPESKEGSPQTSEPCTKQMDSIDISCLQDNLTESPKNNQVVEDSPTSNYKNMAPSITSTPLNNLDCDDNVELTPTALPQVNTAECFQCIFDVPNFQSFQQSAEVRPQDFSEVLLDGESKTISGASMGTSDPTYSDFETVAVTRPQDLASERSSHNTDSSEEFRNFESSIKERPQDLSSLIDASSQLIKSERMSSDIALASISGYDQTSQSRNEQQSLDVSPPITNLVESHDLEVENTYLINFDNEDETEQPHSIIFTEVPKISPNVTYDSHGECNDTYNSHTHTEPKVNGEVKADDIIEPIETQNLTNGSLEKTDSVTKRKNEKFATVNFINETFEELIESNVDEGDKEEKSDDEGKEQSSQMAQQVANPISSLASNEKEGTNEISEKNENSEKKVNGTAEVEVTVVTEDFLRNEKNYCQLDSYLPMLSDIRFTGPATEIMSTSFQDSPTEPTSPNERDSKPDTAADIMKDWDSDTDSHSSNSSSGEFIWKDGDGHETSVLPSTHFEHQRGGDTSSGSKGPLADGTERGTERDGSEGSADSGSGSEGDEVEFVPSSWDCRAAPAKSSLRSLEQATPESKKRVVFKRQKYHCVYEYPREAADAEQHSPAYLPDFSTYTEWDPSNAEEAELCYGQLFSSPSALSAGYPLRAGIAFGSDYDEDFFISSSARPFESLGIMSTSSQFFPGMHLKPSLLERDLPDDVTDDFPPPPSPLPTTTLLQSRTPSLDFTTPDSGVEDITPGSTDDDFKKKIPESDVPWRADSGSSSESVSPSSPGGEALGGLRHTRDKLKLDLPPSPHVPSPRHNRVFNFVLEKPKRRPEDRPEGTTPLVMTDDTPVVSTTLPMPMPKEEEVPIPEPTFSTFGKCVQKVEPEQKIILTDEVETEVKDENPKVVEAVKGEGTVLDSGDEDSGIESSSKATLERNKTPNVS